MEKPWSEIMRWLVAAVGAVVGLFMQMPTAVRLLMLLMVLDYFSGVGAAALGRSKKSDTGALSSKGNAVLYRQRVAVHSGKRGAARCADSGKAQADAGYSEKRKRNGRRRKPENLRHTA